MHFSVPAISYTRKIMIRKYPLLSHIMLDVYDPGYQIQLNVLKCTQMYLMFSTNLCAVQARWLCVNHLVEGLASDEGV